MTRQEMINVLVANLMLTKNIKDKEDGTEYILRNGFKGFNNFSDEELKKYVEDIEPKKLDFLLLSSKLIASVREDDLAQKQK